MFRHATTEDVNIRPGIKNITESPVVRDVLNKLSLVVEKGLVLFVTFHGKTYINAFPLND